MEFLVKKTSEYWNARKPCEEARKEQHVFTDEWACDDPSKIPTFQGREELWYQKGTNHRVENGHIKRDFIEDRWFVSIDSLEDLLAFSDKYGVIILSRFIEDPNIWEIEIYDDYRE